MPLHAPVYGPREATDHEAIWHKGIWIKFEANPEFAKWLVPEPLEYVSNKMAIMIAERRQPPALGYAFFTTLFMPVKFQGMQGGYCPIGFSDSDEMIIGYREHYGFGIVGCDRTHLFYDGNTIAATVTRRQETILKASIYLEEKEAGDVLKEILGRGTFQLQKIPCMDKSKTIRRVLSPHYGRGPNTTVKEKWSGRAALEFPPSVWGLHKLNPVTVERGIFMEITINYQDVGAKVLWEEIGEA